MILPLFFSPIFPGAFRTPHSALGIRAGLVFPTRLLTCLFTWQTLLGQNLNIPPFLAAIVQMVRKLRRLFTDLTHLTYSTHLTSFLASVTCAVCVAFLHSFCDSGFSG